MSGVIAFARETPARGLVGAAVFGGGAGIVVGMTAFSPTAAVVMGIAFAVLAGAAVVDIAERRIPNALTYPGTALALVAAAAHGPDVAIDAVLGLCTAGGVMLLFWFLGRGRLGLGDGKLSAFAGAVLGVQAVPLYLVVGVSAGAVGAAALLLAGRGRDATMPYGPFLAFGAAIALIVRGPLVGG